MKIYNKITELEVLNLFGNVEVIGMGFVPKRLVVQELKTSLYQVNKCCKSLVEQGFLKTYKTEPFHDIEYESGIDYGNSLSIWVTTITDSGVEELKRNDLYHPWWEGMNKDLWN